MIKSELLEQLNGTTAEPAYSFIVYPIFLAIAELMLASYIYTISIYYSTPLIEDFWYNRQKSLFPFGLS